MLTFKDDLNQMNAHILVKIQRSKGGLYLYAYKDAG